MAKAITLKMVVIDPNGVSDDLLNDVETVLEESDFLIIDKDIDEFEFEFDEDAPYNFSFCSYEDAVSALYEQEDGEEQEHEYGTENID